MLNIAVTKIQYYNNIGPRKDHNTICKEVFLNVPKTFYTRKNFYLTPKLNEKIMLLQAAGLTTFWRSQSFSKDNIHSFKKKSTAERAISVHDLSGCFQILLIGLLLSFIIFICEIIKFELMKVSIMISHLMSGY